MNSLFAFFGALLAHTWNFFTDGVLSVFDSTNKRIFNAEFGKETLLASRYNKGFVVTRHRRLTRRKSFENILLISPTGSGKSTRLIFKQLFELKNATIIISDPSGEIFHLCSGYLAKFFKIFVLNFSNSHESSGYNFLSRIKKNSDVNRIADMLAAALGKGNDPFWALQSSTLIAVCIRLVLYMPKEQQHLTSVLHVLNYLSINPETVDQWIVRTGDKKLLLAYKSIVATPDKTLQNIISSAKAAMSAFDNDDFSRVSSYDSIDFDRLRFEPTVIFLRDGISDRAHTQMLNSLFFEQLFTHLLGHLPTKKELDVFFVLDEASSLYLPMLPLFLSNARKGRIGTYLCCQNLEQLEALYGKAYREIYNNCVTKIILPGITSLNFLKELETLSGRTTIKNNDGRGSERPLISAQELRQLGENRSLIVSGNLPFILGRTSPYWRSWFKYLVRSKIPPAQITSDIPDAPPSVPEP